MSQAWISARAGRAIVETEDGTYCLEVESSMSPESCAPEHLANFLAMASDVTLVDEIGPFPFGDMQCRLDDAWRQDRALTTTLMTTDGILSMEVRAEAAQVAACLLAEPVILESVRNRLLAAPLPEVAMHQLDSVPPGLPRDLLTEAANHRETVARISEGWERAAFRLAPAFDWVRDLKRTCIERGGFAVLLMAVRNEQAIDFESWLAKAEAEGGLLADSQAREFLSMWGEETFAAVAKSVPEAAGGYIGSMSVPVQALARAIIATRIYRIELQRTVLRKHAVPEALTQFG